tara:strand:- start:8840 stop:9079 length:240 start_codon:yes stop_codon:yes gene_type:complete
MASQNRQHEKLQLKNRDILEKLNSNQLKLCNILEQLEKKISRLSSDMESVKSYINREENIKKMKLQEEKNISSGWWFSY